MTMPLGSLDAATLSIRYGNDLRVCVHTVPGPAKHVTMPESPPKMADVSTLSNSDLVPRVHANTRWLSTHSLLAAPASSEGMSGDVRGCPGMSHRGCPGMSGDVCRTTSSTKPNRNKHKKMKI